MELKAVHHVGLVVRDLDRSIWFYHDVLGLQFANEPTPWFDGPELEKGVGVPGATLRQVSLWVGENSTMELIEYGNRPASSTAPVPNNFLGAAHVCFMVDDVDVGVELDALGLHHGLRRADGGDGVADGGGPGEGGGHRWGA
jgi:catechol 2,3-dioxygenase-like lactoylglutathione lyase family enzyme